MGDNAAAASSAIPPSSTSVAIEDDHHRSSHSQTDTESDSSEPAEAYETKEQSLKGATTTTASTTTSISTMGRCASAICACATVVAFVILIIGVSTSSWLVFKTSGGARNPVLVNAKLGSPGAGAGAGAGIDSWKRIEYATASYGLWTACYRERKGALSCAIIGLRCKAKVCWTRKTRIDSKRVCSIGGVAPLGGGHGRCIAYQIARFAAAIAAVIGAFGAAGAVVAIFASGKAVAMLAGIASFCSGAFTLTSFVLIYVVLYLNAGVKDIATIGWSLWLVIVSGPLALIAGVVTCCNASLSEPYREISDYHAKH